MKNDSRNNVFNRPASVCFGFLVTVVAASVNADTGLPPPAVHQTTNNSFPSAQALQRQGYDPSRGVLRVNENNRGGATVTKNGGTITGAQNKTVVVTGKYGEKGTINTNVRQNVNVSRLGTAANAVIVGGAVGNVAQNPLVRDFAEKTGNAIKNGDFGGAVHNAIMTGGAALDGILGGILRDSAEGLGKGLGTLPNDSNGLAGILKKANANQAKAEQGGDLAGAIANAAVAKAATAAQQEAQKQDMHEDVVWIASYMGKYAKYGMTPEQACSGDIPGYPAGYTYLYIGSSCFATDGKNKWLWSVNKEVYKYKPSETFTKDATLNGNDVQKILERMLENQQTNHKELMEQLAKIGDVVEQATTSREWTATSTLSEPYTPQGSDTPQQTRFEIDKNGNVTTSTVLRPDLKPNGSQAPTRTVVIPNKAETGQQTGTQQGQQQGQEQGTGQQTGTQQGTGQQQGTTQQTGQQQGTTQQTGQQQGTTQQTGQQTPTTGQTGQQTPTTGQIGQTGQQAQQQQQQKEFCEQNPKSAACAELGETDYEDLSLPEQTIDLNFQPADIFQENGTCPQPKSVNLGVLGVVEFSYQPVCDFALMLRPVLIMMTILTCAWFVYGALEDL